MYSGTAQFYGDLWIESDYGGMEWLQKDVFVRKHTKRAGLDSYTDTTGYIVDLGFEPSIALRLEKSKKIRKRKKSISKAEEMLVEGGGGG